MAVEHTVYTWDPVTAAWVHERGPEITPPPHPPDVHALQSYFYDADSKEWIRTVLAPMGRELAARWQGAHKIPDDAMARAKSPTAAKPKKRSSAPIVAVVVVLLVALGGIAVLASQTNLLSGGAAPATTDAPAIAPSVTPAATPAVSASPSPTVAPTVAGGGGGGGGGAPTPVRTAPPTTLSLPPGLSTRLADGTAVIYTGPTLVVKPQALAATLTFTLANGRPASGSVTVALSTVSAPAQIDANGRVAVTLATTTLNAGQYPLSIIYQGTVATVTQITVR